MEQRFKLQTYATTRTKYSAPPSNDYIYKNNACFFFQSLSSVLKVNLLNLPQSVHNSNYVPSSKGCCDEAPFEPPNTSRKKRQAQHPTSEQVNPQE